MEPTPNRKKCQKYRQTVVDILGNTRIEALSVIWRLATELLGLGRLAGDDSLDGGDGDDTFNTGTGNDLVLGCIQRRWSYPHMQPDRRPP